MNRPAELTYQFEELPLRTELGWQIAPVNGEALIAYYPDGEWIVRSISLEAFKLRPDKSGYDRKTVELDAKDWLFLAILDQLEHSRKDSIQDDVTEALAESAIAPHSDFAEHNTHSRAYQGI